MINNSKPNFDVKTFFLFPFLFLGRRYHFCFEMVGSNCQPEKFTFVFVERPSHHGLNKVELKKTLDALVIEKGLS